jgi:hypothetical protein
MASQFFRDLEAERIRAEQATKREEERRQQEQRDRKAREAVGYAAMRQKARESSWLDGYPGEIRR